MTPIPVMGNDLAQSSRGVMAGAGLASRRHQLSDSGGIGRVLVRTGDRGRPILAVPRSAVRGREHRLSPSLPIGSCRATADVTSHVTFDETHLRCDHLGPNGIPRSRAGSAQEPLE